MNLSSQGYWCLFLLFVAFTAAGLSFQFLSGNFLPLIGIVTLVAFINARISGRYTAWELYSISLGYLIGIAVFPMLSPACVTILGLSSIMVFVIFLVLGLRSGTDNWEEVQTAEPEGEVQEVEDNKEE